MTNQQKYPESDETCYTGRRCAECCELIPSEPVASQMREIGDAVYHFCGPGCYQRWVAHGAEHVDPN